MPRLRENASVGARNGCWGENLACEFLRSKGYEIFERNVTPYARDRRLEIDIVAYEKATDTLVFVEVKQHSGHTPFESRLRSVNRRKIRNLRIACNAWRRNSGWESGYRFDVIEIFGNPGTRSPEIDHIERVDMFAPKNKTVNWS